MTLARWLTAAAEERGRGHQRNGQPCQDAVCVTTAGALPACAVVCDGAGSAPRSDLGARAVSAAVHTLLQRSFSKIVVMDREAAAMEVIGTALTAIREAGASQETLKEYACTLHFVVTDGAAVIAGSIGDGLVIEQSVGGALSVMFPPLRGEFANETVMVTSRYAEASVQLVRKNAGGCAGFALFTDGSGESLYNRAAAAAAPAVGSMLDWFDAAAPSVVQDALRKNVHEFLASSTDDDCGIALLRRVEVTSLEASKGARILELAGVTRSRDLQNRLAAMRYWSEFRDQGNPQGMSRQTYKRHVKWLQEHVALL